MKTVDYDEIDYTEPLGGDTIAIRDAEDRYFDDEEPSTISIPTGHEESRGSDHRTQDTQNGKGDYDY